MWMCERQIREQEKLGKKSDDIWIDEWKDKERKR